MSIFLQSVVALQRFKLLKVIESGDDESDNPVKLPDIPGGFHIHFERRNAL